MDPLSSPVSTIALILGVGWASGINLYATILTLGFLHNAGYMSLPPGLAVCSDPLVMAAAGFMYCIEFFADKVPGIDSGWDTLHTFIRIPAGAALAATAAGDVSPAVQVAAGLVGGTLATGSHTLKAGGRVLINTSPEPLTNWSASVLEDIAVVAGLWTALHYPWLFLLALAAFLLLLAWLLPKIWRGIRGILRAIAGFFRTTRMTRDDAEPAAAATRSPATLMGGLMTIGRFQCGVAALIRSAVDGRYLLLRRADHKDYAAGVWECVTGRLEQGEGFEQALHREVAEEIGAPVRLQCILGTTHFHRGSPSPANESVGVVYGCVLDNPDAVISSSEHSEHRWLTAAEALLLLSANDPSTCWMRGIIERSEALWCHLPQPWTAFAERRGLETDA